MRKFLLIVGGVMIAMTSAHASDGYRLWLRYDPIEDAAQLARYKESVSSLLVEGESPTLKAVRDELSAGLSGLLGGEIPSVKKPQAGTVIAGTSKSSATVAFLDLREDLKKAGPEGFVIVEKAVKGKPCLVVAANSDLGVLYGAFRLLSLMQTRQSLKGLRVVDAPKVRLRLLDHWDNLNRTVERGYAGSSLWDWQKLPGYVSPRITDYARANASLGVNGAVLSNVNANAQVLTPLYLEKVAALADAFRPYGVRVYLTARFNAPMELDGLKTADPLDPRVRKWWKDKVAEIYRHIPDFGGFLVKANSEGQPGPQNYERTHADGANLLARALAPRGGAVMWRAFVYESKPGTDRAAQANEEFVPLDGKFAKNVLVQVKNGPIDFQPREPFHPLFGAMPQTPLMMEFQVTKEYLGFATHLCYLGTLWEECLDSDTHAKGEGSTVARVLDGTLHGYGITGMAGVANTGTDRDWCGSHFDQANWYAFGRLAWDPDLPAGAVADEWIRRTFTNDKGFVEPVKGMMMSSREAVVSYMTPLGLHHLMGWSHHYGPGPWLDQGRADWTAVYYHKADANGIGFDRGATGSDSVTCYAPEARAKWTDVSTCPEELLLWFHHVPWDHRMKSGRILWDELCLKYQSGVDEVRKMRRTWDGMEGKIDAQRFADTKAYLAIQEKEALWWKDACLLYFQTFSKRPFPKGVEKPHGTLEGYRALQFRHVPGI